MITITFLKEQTKQLNEKQKRRERVIVQFSQFGWCFKLFQFYPKVPKFPENPFLPESASCSECYWNVMEAFPSYWGAGLLQKWTLWGLETLCEPSSFRLSSLPTFYFLFFFAWKRQLAGYWNGRTSRSERIMGWSLNRLLNRQAERTSCHTLLPPWSCQLTCLPYWKGSGPFKPWAE